MQLQGTHALPVWSARESETGLSLPSFNAYPQLSVTAAGEYLMMLPQMLESLLTDSEEGLDSEWLDKVRSSKQLRMQNVGKSTSARQTSWFRHARNLFCMPGISHGAASDACVPAH